MCDKLKIINLYVFILPNNAVYSFETVIKVVIAGVLFGLRYFMVEIHKYWFHYSQNNGYPNDCY